MKNDAIVIGAGPAGLVAGRVIASRGFSVTILEKERHLGVKPCGEACSSATLRDALGDAKGDFIIREIKGARVYAPNEKSVLIKGDAGVGCIINKARFLEHLAWKAAEAGATIQMDSPVTDFQRKGNQIQLKTREHEYETGLIIGADGFTSTVAKAFGFEKPGNREVISCYQYHMVNCSYNDESTAEFYLGRDVAPLGYVWVFPKNNGTANVGIGARGTPSKPCLDRFIQNHPQIFSKAAIVGVEGAPVTVGGQLQDIVDDNVMLVGESAGQVIPLTGAGIHAAAVAAQMAARTAIRAIEKEDFSKDALLSYPEEYDVHWGKRIRDSLKALRVLEKLDNEDFNMLAELLDSEDVIDLANGLDIARVGRRFLRNPAIGIKVATALLTA
ncbi:NAD(P)/FAD-dependent oxidoreductase [Candidatus Bathyarchaeota archaeon]|nr:NAD(P)/FAD-dependent oxidoreductase [Candidatus Bathyarchaeota archaeon]